jgi:hypothetical protein
VSEERVHMLACNWRLQRLFAFELRRWEAIEAKRAECLGFIKFSARVLPPARLPPKSTTPPAPAKPLTLKDVRGKRPAEDAEQRPTRKPRGQIRAWRAP